MSYNELFANNKPYTYTEVMIVESCEISSESWIIIITGTTALEGPWPPSAIITNCLYNASFLSNSYIPAS